ncbi:uncharacterized protein LOC105391529 isoform X1 [Plutella xylostella]|uniref:uncharacterized protein LOC105391529 isoform X1 n=1 Tax=Plutella xylostella TaxID=51655 RepID=UPI002032FEC6|nr:uncharacterized protein LOC105391529 isoform X1 [Plutella xylostella]
MWLHGFRNLRRKALQVSQCSSCNILAISKEFYSQEIETKYNEDQKDKILKVVNDSDANVLSKYEITKGRLKKISQWKNSNGKVKSLSDIEFIDGFNIKTATKLFDSIVEERTEEKSEPSGKSNKIKGQILQPQMSEEVRNNCKTALAIYVTVNSVCWTLIDRSKYEVLQWQYYGINHPEGKKFQITDILNVAWQVSSQLPLADVCVMKAEATTLRAAGSDPNNPKVIAVNLQKAQLVAMIVALVNARSYRVDDSEDGEFIQKVYFLRPTLPFRLYGTLVGNERVSTDQTIEMILQDVTQKTTDGSKVYISDELKSMFRAQKDLQKDMLGHCLLLALTFMDLCVYKNQNRLRTLLKVDDV